MLFAHEPCDQTALIAALLRPERYPHPVAAVEHLQTHISHVLLAGDYAYKIKKPLNLGFLDFTSLERRKYYCEEELRLNRRLAPEIYLDCIAIGGEPTQPVWGSTDGLIEYAVRMRRFPQDALLDRALAAGRLEPRHLDALARQLAEFHRVIPVADPVARFGDPAQVCQPMLDDFTHTRPLLVDPADHGILSTVERWTLAASKRLWPRLAERKAGGWVRECHGDLHLGNMILAEDGSIAIFDCIEFNDDFRWIDVINDLAFLTMDLRFRGADAFAQRLLNTYLEYSGDFAGVTLLSFYQVYRAMVRAKINAIQAGQNSIPESARAAARDQCRAYLRLALELTREPAPFLLITHGVSGAGKSRWTRQLLELFPGAIRIRSDVERKRLFGLGPLDNSGSALGQGLYTPDASARTYDHLLALTGDLLAAGHPVLVDATFMKRGHRQPFRDLAARHGVPFILLNCTADPATLRERVAARRARGDDAAEADVKVLERQLRYVEPPAADEQGLTIINDGDLERLRAAIVAAMSAGRHS
ncbi:MAG: AAA family ATPase [Candidatus Competibacter sp.]|nr:AAA family ATPase [Candidatus Competibacter sp.]MDG4604808.1 AAA family ATPase [Candidatus Contendobacter sp.]HRD50737.1 AAA family ATPase [Candidatus Contendobacter sp.]